MNHIDFSRFLRLYLANLKTDIRPYVRNILLSQCEVTPYHPIISHHDAVTVT